MIVYGYLARPGWIGVSDKKFWDYLELLIVPAAIAIGVAVINGMQSGRERKAQEARRNRELCRMKTIAPRPAYVMFADSSEV